MNLQQQDPTMHYYTREPPSRRSWNARSKASTRLTRRSYRLENSPGPSGFSFCSRSLTPGPGPAALAASVRANSHRHTRSCRSCFSVRFSDISAPTVLDRPPSVPCDVRCSWCTSFVSSRICRSQAAVSWRSRSGDSVRRFLAARGSWGSCLAVGRSIVYNSLEEGSGRCSYPIGLQLHICESICSYA